jgi:hypothetical protein
VIVLGRLAIAIPVAIVDLGMGEDIEVGVAREAAISPVQAQAVTAFALNVGKRSRIQLANLAEI